LLFRLWAGGDFGTRIGLFTAQANGRVGHSSEVAAFGVGSPGGDEAKLNRVFLIAWCLGWLAGIQSLALGLVARHWRPFDTPAALKRLRWLCGVATVIGALLLLPSAAIAVPSLPIGFRVGSVMVSVVVAPAICLWVAGFPRKRLVPAQLRFAVRRTVAPNSQPPGKILEPGVLLVTTQPWPQRLWSIHVALGTTVVPAYAVQLLAAQLFQDFKYSQPLLPQATTTVGNDSVLELESLPWPPKTWFSPPVFFDATVSPRPFGCEVAGDIRLPWYPLFLSLVMVLIGIAGALLSGAFLVALVSLVGIGFYLVGRFGILPSGLQGLVRWLSPLSTYVPPATPRLPRDG
jgi:hypothetical protein